MIGGGLMQLVAYGAQDSYITSDRDISKISVDKYIIKNTNKVRKCEIYNEICCLTQDELSNSNKIIICNRCKKYFDYTRFLEYMEHYVSTYKKIRCPHCRNEDEAFLETDVDDDKCECEDEQQIDMDSIVG